MFSESKEQACAREEGGHLITSISRNESSHRKKEYPNTNLFCTKKSYTKPKDIARFVNGKGILVIPEIHKIVVTNHKINSIGGYHAVHSMGSVIIHSY